jgi:hypothetical protein
MGEEVHDLAALTAALNDLGGLPPVDRARAVPGLIHRAMAVLAAVRADAMREAEAGGMKRADIARELDITRQQITKLIGARQAPAGR